MNNKDPSPVSSRSPWSGKRALVASGLAFFAGLTVAGITSELPFVLAPRIGEYMSYGFGAVAVLFAVAYLMRYLQGAGTVSVMSAAFGRQVEVSVRELEKEVETLRKGMIGIAEHERAEIVESLKEQIVGDAASSAMKEITAAAQKAVEEDIRLRKLFDIFLDSRARILTEVDALGRRGNLNLILGAILAGSGIAFLGLTVPSYTSIVNHDPPLDVLMHFVPRTTVTVMMEVFAYFFLALYKSSLSEIKYFQNELTNIELRHAALRAAANSADASLMTDVVKGLSATERNFVIGKNQTTVDLERERVGGVKWERIFRDLTQLLKDKEKAKAD